MLVGDDVVDLGDAEARDGAQHQRFDERVFTPEERAWLGRRPDAARARWALWAAKESVFKVVRKLAPATGFVHRAFRLRSESELGWQLEHEGRLVEVHLTRLGSCLHALATLPALAAQAPLELEALPAQAGTECSEAARYFASRALALRLGVASDALQIVKEAGVPRLVGAGVPAGADLSLSHHGRFVSFACALGAADVVRGVASLPGTRRR